MIVTIDDGINIGISCIIIRTQNKLKSLDHIKECRCFDNFRTSINLLSIGNPDDAQYKIKNLTTDKIELYFERD